MRAKILLVIFACLFLVSSVVEAEESPSIMGVYTKVLGQKYNYDGKKVEIIEFLSFYCGHCYQFEKSIPIIKGNFPKKITWKTIPIYWGKGSPKPGEAYLLAQESGKGEEMKKAIFNAIFVDKKNIGDITVLEEIGAKLDLGFDFSRRLRAGDKAKEAEDALLLAKTYGVNSTPSLIIAGNIMSSPGQVGKGIDGFRDNAIAILISILKL
jgi:thiol:disulfide interchange protein DsbA